MTRFRFLPRRRCFNFFTSFQKQKKSFQWLFYCWSPSSSACFNLKVMADLRGPRHWDKLAHRLREFTPLRLGDGRHARVWSVVLGAGTRIKPAVTPTPEPLHLHISFTGFLFCSHSPLKTFFSTRGGRIKSNPYERHIKALLKTLKQMSAAWNSPPAVFFMLTSVSKHQDGGMYKTPAYPGYPFLMLPDPYLPNGSVSPSVSTLIP